ncbi:MAG: radical SAM protein [Candidatus Scalindua sp.]
MRRSIPKILEFPERVTLELTNHCNLSCGICPRQYTNYNRGFMDSSLFMDIVDEMNEHGSNTLVPFFRGESLLHQNFIKLISYAEDKGMTIQLATNGILLTKEVAKALVEINLDFISFSVDTINPEDYKRMRRGSDFTKLMEGIENLLEEKLKQRSKKPEVQISAVDTGMNDNVKQEFVSFWIDRVQRVRIYPLHTSDGKFGSLQREQKNSWLRLPCHKPFTEMVIYWDGRAVVCNHDWDRNEGLGDVSSDGLLKVWNSEAYQELRENHMRGNYCKSDVCSNCDHWFQAYNEKELIGEEFMGIVNQKRMEVSNV